MLATSDANAEAVPGEETRLIIWTTAAERNRSGFLSERVWVTCVGHRMFRIDNHLCWVDGLSFGDLVEGTPYGEVYQFENLREKGGWWNAVCQFTAPVDFDEVLAFRRRIRELGADFESGNRLLTLVGIPPTVPAKPVLQELRLMQARGRFTFQVRNVGTN